MKPLPPPVGDSDRAPAPICAAKDRVDGQWVQCPELATHVSVTNEEWALCGKHQASCRLTTGRQFKPLAAASSRETPAPPAEPSTVSRTPAEDRNVTDLANSGRRLASDTSAPDAGASQATEPREEPCCDTTSEDAERPACGFYPRLEAAEQKVKRQAKEITRLSAENARLTEENAKNVALAMDYLNNCVDRSRELDEARAENARLRDTLNNVIRANDELSKIATDFNDKVIEEAKRQAGYKAIAAEEWEALEASLARSRAETEALRAVALAVLDASPRPILPLTRKELCGAMQGENSREEKES